MPLGALARLHAEVAFSKVYIYLFIQLDAIILAVWIM